MDRSSWFRRFWPWVAIVALAVLLPFVLPPFRLNLLGRFLALGIVALGVDLIWGYTGSTMRPFWGKIPAGRNCKKATISKKTNTLAIEVVAKKVMRLLSAAGIWGQSNNKEPEPMI